MSVEPSSSYETSIPQSKPLSGNRLPTISRKRRGNLPSIQIANVSRSFGSSSLSLSSDGSTDSDDLSDDSKRGRYDSFAGLDSEGFGSTFSLSDSSTSLSSCDSSLPQSRCGRLFVGGKRSGGEPFIPLKNGQRIGSYNVIGAGKEARAVYTPTKTVVSCQVLTRGEAETIQKVSHRLNEATKYYKKDNVDKMRELVLPSSAELIEQHLEGVSQFVLFSPIHQNSLHNFAKDKGSKMTEVDVKPLFYQIVDILTFCHAVGIILRDLKPGKLVFSPHSSVLRLANVNDCIVLDDPSIDDIQEKCGSPAYVPPEVLEPGNPRYSGKAADIWGLGVLLYLLLLGRYPFYDTTPIGVFQKIKHAKVVIPPTAKLTYGARALIFGLLRRDPLERPSANELQSIPWVATPTPCRMKDFANDITARINTALDGLSEGIRSATEMLRSSVDSDRVSQQQPQQQNVPSRPSQQRRAPIDLDALLGLGSTISRN